MATARQVVGAARRPEEATPEGASDTDPRDRRSGHGVGATRAAPRALRLGALAGSLALVVLGLAGTYRYIWTFWIYRGFPAPRIPTSLQGSARSGWLEQITVPSASVGASPQVLVYLPPGYLTHPWLRYPSLYLLHGVPGEPRQFVEIGDVQVVEASLVAGGEMRPTVLVMPEGALSPYSDTEWANGARRHQAWMHWLAVDVVRAVDRRFRVLSSGGGRGIAGLSEGGYGALNVALHHPREFRLAESWSGYMTADAPRLFGRNERLLAANSPLVEARRERRTLLRDHVYFWFYTGRRDYDLAGNRRFAAQLAAEHIPHEFFVRPGGHNWKLWRSLMSQSLEIASAKLGGPRT